MNNLLLILFVAFFFGFCVFIHELGHFLVAKWRGLHVIAFSIGFKKIWGFKWKGVEYRIGCLPLGGYVDLPQIDSTNDIPTDENGNPLPQAKPIDRILTAFAGPLFNIISGLLLAVPIWIFGIPESTARMDRITIRSISETSPEYLAGLRNGDRITAINGQKFYNTWSQFAEKIIFHSGKIALTVEKPDGQSTEIQYIPAINEQRMAGEKIAYPFFIPFEPAIIYPLPGKPAEKAGLLPDDEIVQMSVNNGPFTPVYSIEMLQQILEVNNVAPTIPCDVKIRRKANTNSISGLPEWKTLDQTFKILAEKNPKTRNLGFKCSRDTVSQITTTSPNDLFKANDIILAINGIPVNFLKVRELFDPAHEQNPSINTNNAENPPIIVADQPVKFEILRDQQRLTVESKANSQTPQITSMTFAPIQIALISEVASDSEAAKKGIKVGDYIKSINGLHPFQFYDVPKSQEEINSKPAGMVPADQPFDIQIIGSNGSLNKITLLPHRNIYQIGVNLQYMNYPTPFDQLKYTVVVTGKTLYGLFDKKSNIRITSLSGPLGIFTAMYDVSKNYGYWQALRLVIIISFSLGIFNLFPLPVLDGGHICLAIIQMIIGKPLKAKLVKAVMFTFVVILILFMIFVTFLDVNRIAKKFESNGLENFTTTLKL